MEQFEHLLLSLDIFIEIKNLCSELRHHFDLVYEDFVQILNVCLNITAWFVNLLKDRHLFLNNFNALFTAWIVLENELLFFLKDGLYQLLMLSA